MMIDVSSESSALIPSTPSRYEIPSDGTSCISSWNWNPAAARSYCTYTQSDATSDTEAPMSALTNGAQVITERIGSPVIGVASQLHQHHENQDAHGDAVGIVLRASGLN